MYSEDPTKAIFFQRSDLKNLIKECLREEAGIIKEPDIEVLTLVEAAKLIHLSPSTIRKFTKTGLLKKLYPEIRKNLYLRSELLRFQKYYNRMLG